MAPSSKKKNRPAKMIKAPGAPRRFKSAYMFFSSVRHKQIRQAVLQQQRDRLEQHKISTPEVAKMVSQQWKNLTPQERAPWIDLAVKDRARYDLEASAYFGPWRVSAEEARGPNPPKKPISVFLHYCAAHRQEIKSAKPGLSTNQVSSILAFMWKSAPKEERAVFEEKDRLEREHYKEALKLHEQSFKRNQQIHHSTSTKRCSFGVEDLDVSSLDPRELPMPLENIREGDNNAKPLDNDGDLLWTEESMPIPTALSYVSSSEPASPEGCERSFPCAATTQEITLMKAWDQYRTSCQEVPSSNCHGPWNTIISSSSLTYDDVDACEGIKAAVSLPEEFGTDQSFYPI